MDEQRIEDQFDDKKELFSNCFDSNKKLRLCSFVLVDIVIGT